MGRPKGSIKPKMMTDALILALNRYADGTKKKQLVVVAQALVDKAAQGDVAAIKEVYDRCDGKVPQAMQGAMDLTGEFKVSWED